MRAAARLSTVLLGAMLLPAAVFFDGPVAQAPAAQTIALTGARLIDGTGRPPIEQATLVIQNGRIEAVGTQAAVSIPAGSRRIDLSGKTIIPGLINAHAHVNADAASRLSIGEQLVAQLRIYADYGVTTVVVLGSGPADVQDALALRDAQVQGAIARTVGRRRSQHQGGVDGGRGAAGRQSQRGREGRHHQDSHQRQRQRYDPRCLRRPHRSGAQTGAEIAAHPFYAKDAHGLLKAGVDVWRTACVTGISTRRWSLNSSDETSDTSRP